MQPSEVLAFFTTNHPDIASKLKGPTVRRWVASMKRMKTGGLVAVVAGDEKKLGRKPKVTAEQREMFYSRIKHLLSLGSPVTIRLATQLAIDTFRRGHAEALWGALPTVSESWTRRFFSEKGLVRRKATHAAHSLPEVFVDLKLISSNS